MRTKGEGGLGGDFVELGGKGGRNKKKRGGGGGGGKGGMEAFLSSLNS